MDFSIILLNFFYSTIGALVTLGFMVLGYKFLDGITPFDAHAELAKGNVAVGIVVGAMFVGIGIAVGLVVGMGLN